MWLTALVWSPQRHNSGDIERRRAWLCVGRGRGGGRETRPGAATGRARLPHVLRGQRGRPHRRMSGCVHQCNRSVRMRQCKSMAPVRDATLRCREPPPQFMWPSGGDRKSGNQEPGNHVRARPIVALTYAADVAVVAGVHRWQDRRLALLATCLRASVPHAPSQRDPSTSRLPATSASVPHPVVYCQTASSAAVCYARARCSARPVAPCSASLRCAQPSSTRGAAPWFCIVSTYPHAPSQAYRMSVRATLHTPGHLDTCTNARLRAYTPAHSGTRETARAYQPNRAHKNRPPPPPKPMACPQASSLSPPPDRVLKIAACGVPTLAPTLAPTPTSSLPSTPSTVPGSTTLLCLVAALDATAGLSCTPVPNTGSVPRGTRTRRALGHTHDIKRPDASLCACTTIYRVGLRDRDTPPKLKQSIFKQTSGSLIYIA